jgi:glyoxylase-like metal-dependent hydrolase (beta-lactamase superfamily II)
MPAAWTEIGDRVFVRRYEFYDQNIGVVLGGDDVLLIDTRSTHVQAREIVDDLRELTTKPVTIVIDTHGHFDHAFGNHVFRPATIWGHVGCGPFLQRTGDVRRARVAAEMPEIAADLAEVVIDPPDRTFSETAFLDLGDRRIELRHLGRGHTDHDIVIGIPSAAVLFAGDLIENGAVPFYNDGYPLDWPETALRIAELSVGVVVPGHGDNGDRRFVEDQAAAIAAIADLARRVRAGELTLDEAVARTPFPAFPPDDVRRPLERALDQLRGELA